MNYDTLKISLQKLIGHFTTVEFVDDLKIAREEFFGNTGTLDENRPHFNLRMHQFYEWFFLTRLLLSYMKTPLHVCSLQRGLRLNEDDLQVIDILKATHRHSLFEFVKIKDNQIYVKNLLTNEKEQVNTSQFIFGFDSKEYFQARTIEISGQKYFLNSFCFHPESSQKFIQNEIKLIRANKDLNPEDLILRLNKMRYKFEQYKHVKPEQIYANDNKLGL